MFCFVRGHTNGMGLPQRWSRLGPVIAWMRRASTRTVTSNTPSQVLKRAAIISVWPTRRARVLPTAPPARPATCPAHSSPGTTRRTGGTLSPATAAVTSSREQTAVGAGSAAAKQRRRSRRRQVPQCQLFLLLPGSLYSRQPHSSTVH